MELVVATASEMLEQATPEDIVMVSAYVSDPPRAWARHLRRILEKPPSKRPRFVGFCIDGNESDSRELFEISECRSWATQLIGEDVGAVRALFDEMEARFDLVCRALSEKAYGRCKLLGLAGHATYSWDSPDTRQGYTVRMTEGGLELLSEMREVDVAELVAEGVSDDQ